MNDKEMEAAREAAFEQTYSGSGMNRAAKRMDFEKGFEAGYNAAQPKPCVWTPGEVSFTGCGANIAKGYSSHTFCPFCGGKIEESE